MAFAKSVSGRRSWFTKKFETDEIKDIIEKTKADIVCSFKEQILKHIKAKFSGILKRLDFIIQQLEWLSRAVTNNQVRYSQNITALVPNHTIGSSSDVFDYLFANPEKPEDGIPSRMVTNRYFRRTIKPILSADDEVELISQESKPGNEMAHLLLDAIHSPYDDQRLSSREAIAEYEPRVESVLSTSVGLSVDFLNKFSLADCVEKMIDAWDERLAKEKNSDEKIWLLSRFEAFFGFQPERSGEQFKFPAVDQVLCHMALSLGRLTRPYWITKASGQEMKSRVFFQTKKMKSQEVSAYFGEINKTNVAVTINIEQQENPFLMLGFSTEGVQDLDKLESTQYFNEPDLINFIRRCENPSGETIYDIENGRNGGLGFVDPSYVTDQELVDRRWRPLGGGKRRTR